VDSSRLRNDSLPISILAALGRRILPTSTQILHLDILEERAVISHYLIY
jgi:hypothetical protein